MAQHHHNHFSHHTLTEKKKQDNERAAMETTKSLSGRRVPHKIGRKAWWSLLLLLWTMEFLSLSPLPLSPFGQWTTMVQAEKAYPLGCSHKDPAYYDYENSVFPPVPISIASAGTAVGEVITDVPIKSTKDYLLTRRLGAGKFSDVFEAVDAEEERRQKIYASSSLSSSLTPSSASTLHPAGSGTKDNDKDAVVDPETLVVLKCLKPVAERKIKRELLVLRHASKLPNLARIKAIVLPPEYSSSSSNNPNTNNKKSRIKSMPTLVLEHGHGDWFCHPIKQQKQRLQQAKTKSTNPAAATKATAAAAKSLSSPYLTEYEIRYYLLHLLVALDHLHSCGIMHRDVKPRNVLIDRRATLPQRSSGSSTSSSSTHPSPLMLIDLGLADFYHPGTRYNVRVASRHYKSPELLLGPSFGYYDYAIDLWGVGCILAGLLFRKEPFFKGQTNLDQLGVIVRVLGTADLLRTIARHEPGGYAALPADVRGLLEEHVASGSCVHRRPWRDFLPSAAEAAAPQDASRSKQTPSPPQQQQQSSSSPPPTPTLFESQGMDLLDKLLVYDGDQRWTARQAVYHPFFDEVRGDVLGQVRLAA